MGCIIPHIIVPNTNFWLFQKEKVQRGQHLSNETVAVHIRMG